MAILSRKSVFRLKKAVAVLERSIRLLLEPVVEVILLPRAFPRRSGVLSPGRGAARGAAGAGGGGQGAALWRGAAGHGALQRWRVHLLQQGCQRGIPRGWPGGAAGTGLHQTRLDRSCGFPLELVAAGALLRQHPSFTSRLAGWLESPGMSLSQPLVPAFMGTPACHVPAAHGMNAVFAFPASRGESSAPIPAVATFWQVPESYAPSLHSDPHHLQSPLGPPKPMLGHHMRHLV